MSGRLGWVACAVLLLLAVVWSARWAAHVPPAAALEPAHLALAVGERHAVRLVSHAGSVVAFGFRLRFDASVVDVEVEGAPPLLSADAARIHLPVRRAPGLVAIDGVAVTGGRKFEPGTALYEITVRGAAAGATTLRVEEMRVVDADDTERALAVAPLDVTVRAR